MTELKQIGRYEIKTEIGRGGMATVYLAHDPRFRRDVAVKVLPRQYTHDPMFRARFDREAQTIAALEHPAIVPVHDFGEDNGQPFLVMRYMPGGSLAEKLEYDALSLNQAAKILKRIASALDRAHSQGIVHRDLKPGNILFDRYDDAYLADFGIAKMAEATAALTGNSLIGTPAYMSPEQVKGGEVDGRSDIYALGVILFEMLTGQQPFEARTPIAVAFKHVHEPIPDMRARKADLSPTLQFTINQAMSKNPDERFQVAADLAKSVETLSSKTSSSQSQPPVAAKPPRSAPPPTPTPTPIQTELLPQSASESVLHPTPHKTPTDIPLPMPIESQSAYPAPIKKRLWKMPLWAWAATAVVALVTIIWGGITLFGNGNGSGVNGTAVNGKGAVASVLINKIATETPTPMPTATIPPTIPPTATETPTMAATETAVPTDTPLPPTATTCPAPQMRVAIASVNIRSGPGSNYDIVTVAFEDDTSPIIAETSSGSWYNIDLGEDERGWVSSTVVELIIDPTCDEDIPVASTIPAPPPPTSTPIPPTNTPAPVQPPSSNGGDDDGPKAPDPPTPIPP